MTDGCFKLRFHIESTRYTNETEMRKACKYCSTSILCPNVNAVSESIHVPRGHIPHIWNVSFKCVDGGLGPLYFVIRAECNTDTHGTMTIRWGGLLMAVCDGEVNYS